RARALERIFGGLHVVLLLQAQQVVGQRGNQLGLDDAFEDRVAVPGDPLEVGLKRVHGLSLPRGAASAPRGFAHAPSGVVCPSTVMPKKAAGAPVHVPATGIAWLGSRVTATRTSF